MTFYKCCLTFRAYGIFSPGLDALAESLKTIGDVIIIAPDREKSATSQSLTITRPLKVIKINSNKYTIDGTPTDCIAVGLKKILTKKPNLIVSGINLGGNLGDDINYSGTVAAAKEGTLLGIPSFAISVVALKDFIFEAAMETAPKIAIMILKNGLPANTLLNVNLPLVTPDKIKGFKFTKQGKRVYNNSIMDINDPWGKPHFWIGGIILITTQSLITPFPFPRFSLI
ncbi:MAG: 5'/3'-nucleotidase SurE [Nitrospirae bacterium]|nr:5'/3'-nucleotidase SurE [Nitrospirota bacterium]